MKDKITTFLFLIIIFGFGIFHIALPDNEISSTERRKLSSFPKFELTSKYSEKLDKYLLDHFPLRDTFRSIKARFNYNVLQKLDNNDIYLKDNYIFKSEYPTNKELYAQQDIPCPTTSRHSTSTHYSLEYTDALYAVYY